MSPLAVGLIGGLIAMFGWGVADFFAKISVDTVGELPSLVWGHLVGTVLLAVGAAAGLGNTAANHAGISGASVALGLVLFGVLQAAVYYLLYRGFSQGQVAVLSPTFACFSGVVALVSILLLGEHASAVEIGALAAVFLGVLLLSAAPTDGTRIRIFGAPGFGPVALAMVLAACWTLGWGHLVSGHRPLLFATIMYAVMTLALAGVAKQQGVRLLDTPRHAWPALLVIGLGEASAYGARSWAYSKTTLISVIALVSGAFSLPTIILARTFLKERLGMAALGGAAAVIAGTTLLAMSR